MSAKLGRNDPCRCGSGRKYKQCCLRAVVASEPNAARMHYESGSALHSMGRLAQAADQFRAAIAAQADFVEAHVNLGNVLHDQGQAEAAARCFRRALQLRPDFVDLHLNIGLSLHALRRFDEAIGCYREALARGASAAQSHSNLAAALRDAGRLEEAVESYRTALAIDPRAAGVHHGLAGTLLTLGKIDEAIASYRRALVLDPALTDSHSALLLTLLYSDTQSPADVLREHRQFGERFARPLHAGTAPHANAPDPERRLKIGYVSGDFRVHSVAYFIEPILARHDRSRFEVHCYYTAPVKDAATARLRAMADGWLDCAQYSDQQLAERIRLDGIDLLVDLSGHTLYNRLTVFARKPAPVQASWIGYPSSTGLPQIDYRLTDYRASPARDEPSAVAGSDGEALYRLPRIFSVYRPPADAPEVEPIDATADAPITLGSFNNCAKISDSTVRLWSRILRSRPSLRMALKGKGFGDAAVQERMVRRFCAHGVDREQLTLLSRTASDREHLALYQQLDIALDTFPYCGVTTTCEALWMGVPVISLAGDTFVSRMGATLLDAVGHPDWVATDEEGYLQRVLALAGDPTRRAALRLGLREQMRNSPLMDEVGFTRELEAAYRDMWRRWCER